MATNVKNASDILDALMDWRGKPALSAARKVAIAEKIADFIGVNPPPGNNNEKADAFLQYMWQEAVHPLRQRAEQNKKATNEAGVVQAGDDEVTDL